MKKLNICWPWPRLRLQSKNEYASILRVRKLENEYRASTCFPSRRRSESTKQRESGLTACLMNQRHLFGIRLCESSQERIPHGRHAYFSCMMLIAR